MEHPKDIAVGQTTASTETKQTYVHITGGENILVAGGGGTYATADNGQESTVLAQSTVDSALLVVDGGSVDGLYGGGIAIDDTNAEFVNSKVVTSNISIEVNGGDVNEANVAPIVTHIKGQIGETGAPTNGAYVNDTVTLIDQANVAILGAGMASGAGATAETTISFTISGSCKIDLQITSDEITGIGAGAFFGKIESGTITVGEGEDAIEVDPDNVNITIDNESDSSGETEAKILILEANTDYSTIKGSLNEYDGIKGTAKSIILNVDETIVLNRSFSFESITLDGGQTEQESKETPIGINLSSSRDDITITIKDSVIKNFGYAITSNKANGSGETGTVDSGSLTLNIENSTFCYAPLETNANTNTPLFRFGSNNVTLTITASLFGPSMASEESKGSNALVYTAGTVGSIFLNASKATVNASRSFKTDFGWWADDKGTTYPIDGLQDLGMSEIELWQSPSTGDFKVIGNVGEAGIGDPRWGM